MLDDPVANKYNLPVPGVPGSNGREMAIILKLAAQLQPPVRIRRCSPLFRPFCSIGAGTNVVTRKQPHVRERRIIDWAFFTQSCQPLARQQPAQGDG